MQVGCMHTHKKKRHGIYYLRMGLFLARAHRALDARAMFEACEIRLAV